MNQVTKRAKEDILRATSQIINSRALDTAEQIDLLESLVICWSNRRKELHRRHTAAPDPRAPDPPPP